MTIPQNSRCFCNGGIVVKNCCLRSTPRIGRGPETPTTRVSNTIEHYVFLNKEPNFDKAPEGISEVTLFSITSCPTSFRFADTFPISNEVLRLSLVDSRLKPVLKLKAGDKVVELICPQKLPVRKDRPYHFVVYTDYENSHAELLIDGEIVATQRVSFDLDIFGIDPCFASGEHFEIVSSCMYFGRIPFEKLMPTNIAPTSLDDGWELNDKGGAKWYRKNAKNYLGCSFWYISQQVVDSIRGQLKPFPDRFLEALGTTKDNFDSLQNATAEIHAKLSQFVNSLDAIIKSENAIEMDILTFFKDNPAAVMMIEPDFVRIWRETELQDFGQIDFVIEKVGGRVLVVEAESPNQKIFNNTNEFDAKFNHAVDQVSKWIRGTRRSPETVRRKFGNKSTEWFDGLVIIGRSSKISNDERRDRWAERSNGIALSTWDDVVERGQTLANRFNDPVVAAAEWQKNSPIA